MPGPGVRMPTGAADRRLSTVIRERLTATREATLGQRPYGPAPAGAYPARASPAGFHRMVGFRCARAIDP